MSEIDLAQAERGSGCQPVAVVKQDRRMPLVIFDREHVLGQPAAIKNINYNANHSHQRLRHAGQLSPPAPQRGFL